MSYGDDGWERPYKAAPAGQRAGTLVPFSAALSWLRDALQVRGSIPTHLDAEAVYPTLDVAQGGWGHVSGTGLTAATQFGPSVAAVTIAPSTVAGTIEIVALSPLSGILVLGASAEVVGGAGSQTVWFHGGNPSAPGWDLWLGEEIINVNTWGTWAEFGRGAGYWCLLPNWRLAVTHQATGVGQSIEILVSYLRYPAGTKPI